MRKTYLVAFLLVANCTPAKEAAVAKMEADGAVCVMDQYEKNPSVTPEQVVVACAGVVLVDAAKVLFAAKRTKLGAAPCGSASGK